MRARALPARVGRSALGRPRRRRARRDASNRAGSGGRRIRSTRFGRRLGTASRRRAGAYAGRAASRDASGRDGSPAPGRPAGGSASSCRAHASRRAGADRWAAERGPGPGTEADCAVRRRWVSHRRPGSSTCARPARGLARAARRPRAAGRPRPRRCRGPGERDSLVRRRRGAHDPGRGTQSSRRSGSAEPDRTLLPVAGCRRRGRFLSRRVRWRLLPGSRGTRRGADSRRCTPTHAATHPLSRCVAPGRSSFPSRTAGLTPATVAHEGNGCCE